MIRNVQYKEAHPPIVLKIQRLRSHNNYFTEPHAQHVAEDRQKYIETAFLYTLSTVYDGR